MTSRVRSGATAERVRSWTAVAVSLVVVAGALASALSVAWHRGTLLDVRIYRLGGSSVLHHRDALYDLRDAASNLPFTYPPFAAIVFAPLTAIGQPAAEIVMTVLSVAATVIAAGLLVRRLPVGHTLQWVCWVLFLVTAAFSEPVVSTLQFGQINLIVLALAVQAFLRPGSRWSAIGLGIATGMKLTPGIFILGLLVCGRWRDAGRATAGATGTIAVGLLVFPHSSWVYFTGAGFDGTRIGTVDYLANQSVNGVLWRLLGPGGSGSLWLMCGIVLLATGLWTTGRLYRAGDVLGALASAALTGVLISPVSWTHHWVVIPLFELVLIAPVLARIPMTRGVMTIRLAVVAGWLALTISRVVWRVPHGGDVEYHQTFAQFVAGNSYVEWGLVTLGFLTYLALPATKNATGAGRPEHWLAVAAHPLETDSEPERPCRGEEGVILGWRADGHPDSAGGI